MTSNSSADRALNILPVLILTLVIVGYPVAGILVEVTGLQHRLITYPYRGVVALLSVVAIVLSFYRGIGLLRATLAVTAFVALYGGRLIFDLLVAGNPAAPEATVVFFTTLVLPFASILLTLDTPIIEKRFQSLVLAFGGPVVVLALFFIFTRPEVIERGRATFCALNSISLAQVSAAVFLTAVVAMSRAEHRRSVALLALLSIVATLVFLYANSRGPILALLAATVFLVATDFRKVPFLLPGLVTVPIWLAVNFKGTSVVRDGSDGVAGRLGQLADAVKGVEIQVDGVPTIAGDASLALRWDALQSGVDGFLRNPLLGSYFVDPGKAIGLYPHNLIVETAMALGVVGLVLLAISMYQAAIATFRVVSTHHLLAVLFVQTAAMSMVSGAILGGRRLGSARRCRLVCRTASRDSRRNVSISRTYLRLTVALVNRLKVCIQACGIAENRAQAPQMPSHLVLKRTAQRGRHLHSLRDR